MCPGWGFVGGKSCPGGVGYRGRVVGEGAVCLPDCGNGAVARVGHGVVEVTYGFVGESVARISLLLLGFALLSVVCHCCRSALMWAISVLQSCML